MAKDVLHLSSRAATARGTESSAALTSAASPVPLTAMVLPTSASMLVGSSSVVALRPA
jgi:hypothetical protein